MKDKNIWRYDGENHYDDIPVPTSPTRDDEIYAQDSKQVSDENEREPFYSPNYKLINGRLCRYKPLSKSIRFPREIHQLARVTMNEPPVIEINPSVDKIEEYSIFVPGSITQIPDKAFCVKVNRLILEEGVLRIGKNIIIASNIESLEIPSSVVEIKEEAFAGPILYSSINSLTISSRVSHVTTNFEKTYGFNVKVLTIRNEGNLMDVIYALKEQEVTTLVKIIIEGDLTPEIKKQIYSHLPNVITVEHRPQISTQNNLYENDYNWTIEDGVLTEYKHSEERQGNRVHEVIIPEGVKIIAKNVFKGKKLTSVKLPSTLEEIRDEAFADNNLTEVELPEGLRDIGSLAFDNNQLSHIKIPQSVVNLGVSPFGAQNPLEHGTLEIYDTLGRIYPKESKPLYSLGGEPEELIIHNTRGYTLDALEMFLEEDIREYITSLTILDNPLTIGEIIYIQEHYPNITSIKTMTDTYDDSIEWSHYNCPQYRNPFTKLEANNITYEELTNVIVDTDKDVIYSSLQQRGIQRIILPTTLEIITDEMLEGNELRTITFPPNIKFIGFNALANNFLTRVQFTKRAELSAAAFYGNDIRVLSLTDDFKSTDGLDKAFEPTIKTLYIDNSHDNAITAITALSNQPLERIIVTGKKLSIKDKIAVTRLFGRIPVEYKKITIDLITEKAKPKPVSPPTPLDSLKDLLARIEATAKILSDEEQKELSNHISTLIKKYEDTLEEYKNSTTVIDEETPMLRTIASPQALKDKLFADLNAILTDLNHKTTIYSFIRDLVNFKRLAQEPILELPNNIDTAQEKIQYITYIATDTNSTQLTNELTDLIDKCITKTRKSLNDQIALDFVLDNAKATLNTKLKDILAKALRVSDMKKTLYGKTDNELSKDIKKLESIIKRLDDRNAKWYQSKLDTLRQKYMSSELTDDTTRSIRQELDEILKELSQTVAHVMDKTTLLNSIDNSIKLLRGEEELSQDNILSDLVTKIVSLMIDNRLGDYKQKHYYERALNFLKQTLENINVGKEIPTTPSDKSMPHYIEPSWKTLNGNAQATIQVCYELTDIIYDLETELARIEELEGMSLN